jgi:hypothetical protein
VSAYVTHGVFPNQSWGKFKAENGGERAQLLPPRLAPGRLHRRRPLLAPAAAARCAAAPGGAGAACWCKLVQAGASCAAPPMPPAPWLTRRPPRPSPPPADGSTAGFRYFWLTDSCPQTVRDIEAHAPFEVLSLAAPIAAALQI